MRPSVAADDRRATGVRPLPLRATEKERQAAEPEGSHARRSQAVAVFGARSRAAHPDGHGGRRAEDEPHPTNGEDNGVVRYEPAPAIDIPALARRPGHLTPADDVQVQVGHRFPRVRPDVEHQAVAGLLDALITGHFRAR